MRPSRNRRLIVNADDFGRSSSINHAVIRAHREGILTSASLMVNGEACDEAVALAREHRTLGVGLHLTLVCGRAASSSAEIPGLVEANGCLSDNAVATGFRYAFQRMLVPQLEREIDAQFQKFRDTNLPLDHVNGHLNMHLHPVIFAMLCRRAGEWGIGAMRVTRDLFWLSCATSRGRWAYRLSHALIFSCLSWRAARRLDQLRVRRTRHVFGLLESGRVTADYVLKLLPRIPEGDSELYSHPSLDEAKPELDALIDPRVTERIREEHIQLIRYQDL